MLPYPSNPYIKKMTVITGFVVEGHKLLKYFQIEHIEVYGQF